MNKLTIEYGADADDTKVFVNNQEVHLIQKIWTEADAYSKDVKIKVVLPHLEHYQIIIGQYNINDSISLLKSCGNVEILYKIIE